MDDVRWLTYDELAKLRGISRASATRLAMRRNWPRRAGNDGKARIGVPGVHDMSPPDIMGNAIPDKGNDVTRIAGEVSPPPELVKVLQDQVADLTGRLTAADIERGRLLELIEKLATREPVAPAEVKVPELEAWTSRLRRLVKGLRSPRSDF